MRCTIRCVGRTPTALFPLDCNSIPFHNIIHLSWTPQMSCKLVCSHLDTTKHSTLLIAGANLCELKPQWGWGQAWVHAREVARHGELGASLRLLQTVVVNVMMTSATLSHSFHWAGRCKFRCCGLQRRIVLFFFLFLLCLHIYFWFQVSLSPCPVQDDAGFCCSVMWSSSGWSHTDTLRDAT